MVKSIRIMDTGIGLVISVEHAYPCLKCLQDVFPLLQYLIKSVKGVPCNLCPGFVLQLASQVLPGLHADAPDG